VNDTAGGHLHEARRLLWPLGPLYGAATGAKRWLARWGLVRRKWLKSPVISVGSCSVGGAGKTPMVLLLAQILKRRGYQVSILTRGYGRHSRGVERVNPAGDARWFGDEPMLMARRSGAPVFVGADRYRAGLLAENSEGEERVAVHLLDDGFQHWRLGREADMVLLTEEDLKDSLLPAGNLREPLAAIEDADVIVLREDELRTTADFVARMRQGVRVPLIWVIRRRLSFMTEGTAELAGDIPVRAEPPAKALVFCGIARPKGFVEMLRKKEVNVAEVVAFADHYEYREEDMSRLAEAAKATGADGFITTEKDAVKLNASMRAKLEEVGPVVVAKLELELIDERASVDKLVARVQSMERRKTV
jgi:tetraacyldisaccharide 4'-kinase